MKKILDWKKFVEKSLDLDQRQKVIPEVWLKWIFHKECDDEPVLVAV